MIDLNKLAAELHEAAVAKGFWDVEDALPKHIAKMISELGEVVQADRAGVMYEIEHLNSKPEGVIAELADFAMMMLDLMKQYEYVIPDMNICDWFEITITRENLHRLPAYELANSLAAEFMRIEEFCVGGDNEPFLAILFGIHEWVRGNDYDLWEIIRQKMEYNKSRPALHGRLY